MKKKSLTSKKVVESDENSDFDGGEDSQSPQNSFIDDEKQNDKFL